MCCCMPYLIPMYQCRQKEWTGDYITDFQRLLPGLRDDDFTYDDEEVQCLKKLGNH